jgi:hypothetical protein
MHVSGRLRRSLGILGSSSPHRVYRDATHDLSRSGSAHPSCRGLLRIHATLSQRSQCQSLPPAQGRRFGMGAFGDCGSGQVGPIEIVSMFARPGRLSCPEKRSTSLPAAVHLVHAVLENGVVYSWGADLNGELGSGIPFVVGKRSRGPVHSRARLRKKRDLACGGEWHTRRGSSVRRHAVAVGAGVLGRDAR